MLNDILNGLNDAVVIISQREDNGDVIGVNVVGPDGKPLGQDRLQSRLIGLWILRNWLDLPY